MKSLSLRQGNKPSESESTGTDYSITPPFAVCVLAAPLIGAELTTIIRAALVPGCEDVRTVCDVCSLTRTPIDSLRHGNPQPNVVLMVPTSGWDLLTESWMQQKSYCYKTVLALDCQHPNIYTQIAMATAHGVGVFVTTDDMLETLSRALRAAALGQNYTSNRLQSALRDQTSQNDLPRSFPSKAGLHSSSHDSRLKSWIALSQRQREVATLASEGLSNKEIAERLFVNITTVKTHLEESYRKMGICRRSQLVHHLNTAT